MNVVAIIPAYNEEHTIGDVLSVLKKNQKIKQIIVVSDGSTDDTVEVAKSFGVEVIDLFENQGKGAAMKKGLERGLADIILFLDADLVGLKNYHVNSLLEPVLKDKADVTIGIFEDGRILTDFAQKITPKLSGQRAIRASVLDNIPDMEIARFGVESVLNDYIKSSKSRVQRVLLKNMSHITKEEKLGLFKGVNARVQMYWDIVKYTIEKNRLK